MSNYEQHVVVMGAGGVGKTALAVRFVQHRFVADYEPTIEDSFRKQINLDGGPMTLDILDTAGQEEFMALKAQYMASGEGFMLVYSMTEPETLPEVRALYDQIMRLKRNPPAPVVLVANKLDLVTREPSRRAVSREEGERLAASFNAPYFETSAKDGIGVDAAWMALVRATQKATNKPPLPGSRAASPRGASNASPRPNGTAAGAGTAGGGGGVARSSSNASGKQQQQMQQSKTGTMQRQQQQQQQQQEEQKSGSRCELL